MTTDLAFYNVGCEDPRGPRRVVVLARRALRRVLRPIFQRQVALFQALCDRLDAAERDDASLRAELATLARRQDDLNEQTQATIAFGWDYVAMVRRLAALEDRVEALTAALNGQGDDPRASVPFPGSEGAEVRAEAC